MPVELIGAVLANRASETHDGGPPVERACPRRREDAGLIPVSVDPAPAPTGAAA